MCSSVPLSTAPPRRWRERWTRRCWTRPDGIRRTRILFLPAEHRLLGRKVCRVEQCTATAHNDYPDICHRCFTRLTRMGMTMDDIAASDESSRRARARAALRGP